MNPFKWLFTSKEEPVCAYEQARADKLKRAEEIYYEIAELSEVDKETYLRSGTLKKLLNEYAYLDGLTHLGLQLQGLYISNMYFRGHYYKMGDILAVSEPVWTILDQLRMRPDTFTGKYKTPGSELSLYDESRDVNFNFSGLQGVESLVSGEGVTINGFISTTISMCEPKCDGHKWMTSTECRLIINQYESARRVIEERLKKEAEERQAKLNIIERAEVAKLYGVENGV